MVKHYVPWYTWLLWPSDAVRHVTSYFYLQKPLLAFWYDPSLKTGQSFNLLLLLRYGRRGQPYSYFSL